MSLLKKIIFKIVLFSNFLFVSSQGYKFEISDIYPVDNAHSYIEFSVKYMGQAEVKGNFEKFYGTFRYVENDIKNTSITISIPVKSIDTNNKRRDQDLLSNNWFDEQQFKFIEFVSHQVEKSDDGYNLIGSLTMKNVTKQVVFKMKPSYGILSDFRGDSQVILEGNLVISRKDFNISGSLWSKIKEGVVAVSDEVNINISILGKQINLKNLRNWVRDSLKPEGMLYRAVKKYGVNEGIKLYTKLKKTNYKNITYKTLDIVGQVFLKEEEYKVANEIFQFNISEYPTNSKTYISYAIALASQDNLLEAKNKFLKARSIDLNNEYVREVLRHLM